MFHKTKLVKKNQMENSLLLSLTRVSPAEQLKQGFSEAPSLVACFILGKVYCKPELTEDDMPVV